MMLPLSVDSLEVKAPDGRPLLTVEHLSVPSGTALAVRGPSGAGKTTFLNAISGLSENILGHIKWGDVDIARQNDTERTRFRRENIGMVFQDFLLFEELTALQNACLAANYLPSTRRSELRERAQSTLSELGLDPAETRTVTSYSGGERQRIAIARALAADPAIVLADEPTASLDRATADRLTKDLIAFVKRKGKTLITVTHDPVLIEVMEKVIDFEDGRVVGHG